MAEILIGDVVARIRADATEFQRGIDQATQALQRFQHAMQQQAGTVQPSVSRTSQAFEQLRQQLTLLNQQAISQTGFLGQMAAGFDQLNASLQRTTRTTQESTQQAQRWSAEWRQALQVAAGIGLATTIQGLVRTLTNFASESVTLAARMQDLNLTFRAIEGSAAGASRTMEFLFTTAQRIGVEFTSVAEAFRRMDVAARGTSLEGEGIRRVFEGVVSGTRVLGVSSAETQRALTALEQMMTKGRLSAEEYRRQLGNAIPGALQFMAQGLGVTTRQLEDMIRLGIIPAESALIALGNTMGQLRQQSGADTLEQLSSTFNRLKNETTAWMAAIGEGLAQSIQPFLQSVIQISAELRKLLAIRPPGTGGGGGSALGWLQGLFVPTPLNVGEPQPQGLTASRSPFVPAARRIAEAQGIDPNIFTAMIQRESGFNPTAVSRAGAVGLGQMMPATAASEFGVTDIAQLRNPETNLTLSAQLFARYRERIRSTFGQLEDETKIVLAAYNAGIGRVMAALEETRKIGEPLTIGQVLGRLPAGVQAETRPYVQAITQMAGAPLGQVAAPGATAAAPGTAPQDPFAPMVASATKIRETLGAANTAMDNLSESTLNWGGQLNDVMTEQVQQAAKEFERIGTMLATQPQLLARMKPEQREIVEQAAKELAIMRQRLAEEAQTPAEARRRIQELREAEQLQERINAQNIADDEHRRDVIDQITKKLEQQAAAAREALPGLEALLSRADAFADRPGQALPEQARARVQQQGVELEAALRRALAQVAQSPELRAIAPALTGQLTEALATLPATIQTQGQLAFDRINEQTRLRIAAMGDQIEQLGERIAGAGLDPLSAALAAIRREFDGMLNQLDAVQRSLEELAKTATPERQTEIAAQIAAIEALREQAPEGRERREAQARFRLELLPRLEEPRLQSEELDAMRNQIEDLRIQRLNQQQGPFGMGRVQTRQERQMMERFTPENREEAEQLQAQLRAQERLNYAAGLFAEVATDVGTAWTRALFSIADGTQTVSQAFEQMAQSILRSMAEIAAQEGFKALLRLGIGLIAGGVTGGLGGGGMMGSTGLMYEGAGAGFAPATPPPIGFQHGGQVNRPTLAMIGEGAHNPEYVLNSRQMNQMMSEAVSRGASAGNQAVSIFNYPSKQAAEEAAGRERSLGKTVVLNEVMADLRRGESSIINRTLRTLQR